MAKRILFIFTVIVAILYLQPDLPSSVSAQRSSSGKLTLVIAPSVLPADETAHSVAYLQMEGNDGTPTLALQKTEVSLSSSNRSVVNIPDVAYIEAGRSYVVVPLTTSSTPGTATITAVASDLGSVTEVVKTFSTLGAEPPLRLALYASPVKMLPNSQPSGQLNVVLLGANGRLAPAARDLDVVLTSSNPDVVQIARHVTISKDSAFATIAMNPLSVGNATISAALSGFTSDSTQVQVMEPGQSADALILHLSPPVLPSGIENHPGVIIQAIDNSGTPVYFPCTQIFLTSSSPQSVEIVSGGGSACDQKLGYVEGILTISDIPGIANISAVATGLRPGAARLEIQGQVPFKLGAFLAPESPMGAENPPGVIVVQIQDSNGAPVNLHGGVTVKLVGKENSLQEEVTIPHGQSYTNVDIQGGQSEPQIDLSLVSPGLASAHLSTTLYLLPLNVELSKTTQSPIFPGDKTEITVRVLSRGIPVPKAALKWSATAGGILGFSETAHETDNNGEGRIPLTTQYPGDIRVSLAASKPGYLDTESQMAINVMEPQETSSPSPKLFGIPILLLFLIFFVSLLGYIGYKYWPSIKPHLKFPTRGSE